MSLLQEALPIIEAEAVALAMIGGIHVHDRITGQQKLRRMKNAAAILTGTQGHSLRHPVQLWRALRAGGPDTLPGAARALVVGGICFPIPGPVDEATALSAVLVLLIVPRCRKVIGKAWKVAEA
jgi:hypothetical protein